MGAVLPQREYGPSGRRGPPGSRAARRRPGPGPATGRPGRARCFPPRAPRSEQRRRSRHHQAHGTTGHACAERQSQCPRSGKRSLPARGERSERPVAGPARRRTLTSREAPPGRSRGAVGMSSERKRQAGQNSNAAPCSQLGIGSARAGTPLTGSRYWDISNYSCERGVLPHIPAHYGFLGRVGSARKGHPLPGSIWSRRTLLGRPTAYGPIADWVGGNVTSPRIDDHDAEESPRRRSSRPQDQAK